MFDGIVTLDRGASLSLTEQIYRQIRQAVRHVVLQAGQAMPSSRALAAQLGVSRNTVNAAYELLRAEGILTVTAGAVPVLARPEEVFSTKMAPARSQDALAPALSQRGAALAAELRGSAYVRRQGLLSSGTPDPDLFPRDLWARSLRRAARELSGPQTIYDQVDGLPGLKTVLARYLAQSRGVRATPEQILIVPSVQAGLALIAQCLTDPGDTVWMEEPGYLGARAAFAGAGLSLQPMSVDTEGANTIGMDDVPRLIYVTPSHQYPTGAKLSLSRRLALLTLARRHGALVLEDDYDSEFLWQGRPVAALQGLSEADEVIYLGTSAKTLLPGLRLAYMVLPAPLVEGMRGAQANMGLLVNVHVQAAFADFIDSGQYRTHLNKISKAYAARGAALVAALRARLGNQVAVTLPHGGLQVMVRFAAGVDDREVARHLGRSGFSVPALSGYFLGPGQPGVLVGFASATVPVVARFADELAAALGLD